MDEIRLEELLSEQLRQLKGLNKIVLEKQAHIMQKNVEALNESIKAEEAAVNAFSEFSAQHDKEIKQAITAADNGRQFSLKMRNLLTEVRNAAVKLRSNCEFNQGLMKDELGMLRFIIKNINSITGDTNIYGDSGKVLQTNSATRSIIDVKG